MEANRIRSYLVIEGPRALRVATGPVIRPDATSALIRSIATGMSAGTERMWYLGTNPAVRTGRRSYPYFPGYSLVGRVIQRGKDAPAGVSVGDRVLAMKPHATHAVLRKDDYWVKVPDSISDEDALAVPLTATCVHALHQAGLQAGAAVVVIGLGVLGLLCCQVMRQCGAGQVIAVGRSHWKRELALHLGADLALDPREPGAVGRVTDATAGRGADVAVECAGAGQAIETALSLVRNQGRVVVAGFHTEPFPVSGELLFAKELTLVGVRSAGGTAEANEFHRWNRRANFEFAAQLVFSGKVLGAPLTTHRFGYQEVQHAYDLICDDRLPHLQVLLEWQG